MQEKTLDSKTILEKALSVFTDINARIHSLIDCSARDFDTLNQGFKEYYSNIRIVTDSTRETLQTIIELPEDTLSDVRKQLEKITFSSEAETSGFEHIRRKLKNTRRSFSHVFLNVNCVKQNISTLKLLATNLQFEPEHHELYFSLIRNLIELSEQLNRLESELESLEKRIDEAADLMNLGGDRQIPECISEVKNLYNRIEEIDQKKEECSEYKATLEKLLSEKSMSSSEIITNLQFQDIIRQKIEHVQQAHELLQQNLRQAATRISGSADPSPPLDPEILFQIRDIGSLQAAQLVHANQEYQKAVENIINKFSNLDEIFTETLKLQGLLLPESQTGKQRALMQFRKTAAKLEIACDNRQEMNQAVERLLESIMKKNSSILTLCTEIEENITETRELSEALGVVKGGISGERIHPVKQLQESIAAFALAYNKLKQILTEDECAFSNLREEEREAWKNEQTQTSGKYEALMNACKQIIDTYVSSGDTKTTRTMIEWEPPVGVKMENVVYYHRFDREVEEIINQLNSLIGTIDFDKLDRQYEKSDLETIRKQYTMQSERKIHDLQTGKDNSEPEDGEDDIELFT